MFTKPNFITNPINLKTNNKISSSLIIKKINKTQNTLAES